MQGAVEISDSIDDWRLAGFGPDSEFGFGLFPEFGFGSVSASACSDSYRPRMAPDTRGSDSDRFRPPRVRIRIGGRFGSDSASEPGLGLSSSAG